MRAAAIPGQITSSDFVSAINLNPGDCRAYPALQLSVSKKMIQCSTSPFFGVPSMKKFFIVFIVAMAIGLSAKVFAADEHYVLGLAGFSPESEKQMVEVLGSILKNLSDEDRLDIELLVYDTNEQLQKAIADKKVNIFIHEDYNVFPNYLRDERVEPFISYMFYGVNDPKKCTFVQKDSEAKSLLDLRGKNIGFFGSSLDYYSLTELLGEKPYTFFKSIKRGDRGQGFLWQVARGELDAAFVMSYATVLLKMSTPEIAKEIKMVDCPVLYNLQPIFFVKDSTDPAVKEKILNIFTNYKKDKAFKTSYPCSNSSA